MTEMINLKLHFILSFLIFWMPLQAVALCLDPGTTGFDDATELASTVEKMSIIKIEPKFCESFKACEEFSHMQLQEQAIKEQEYYFSTLEQSIASSEAHLEFLKKNMADLKAAEPVDYIKIKSAKHQLQGAMKALTDLNDDLLKYQYHLKDPEKNPHPMKDKGIGLTKDQKLQFSVMKEEKSYDIKTKAKEEYYKELSEKIELQKKILNQLSKESNPSEYKIMSNQSELKKYEEDLAAYELHLKDPDKVPHPMKLLELGLTPEEKNKKSLENAYKMNKEELLNNQSAISELYKEIKKLKSKKQNDDVGYLESAIKSYLFKLKKVKAIDQKYQAYLKNPSAQPNFFGKNPFSGFEGDKNDCSDVKSFYVDVSGTLSSHKAGTCGMSPEEMVMLKYYSDNGFGCLNSYLRQTKTKNPQIDYLVSILNNGLDKLPSYEGIVKRGAHLPQEIQDQHKAGKMITYNAYTSTSTSGGFGGQDIFYIYSKTGKPIMGFSDHMNEFEILFKTGAKFKILENKSKNGINYYIMKEVSGMEEKDEEDVDKKIVDQVRNSPSLAKGAKSDFFHCPVKQSKKVHSKIKQQKTPEIVYPKD